MNEQQLITVEEAKREVFSKEYFEQFDSRTLAQFCIDVIRVQQQTNTALKWIVGSNRISDIALFENKKIVDELLKSRKQ